MIERGAIHEGLLHAKTTRVMFILLDPERDAARLLERQLLVQHQRMGERFQFAFGNGDESLLP